MRALLIEVDFKTGKRAGGVNPRDPKLQCYGWQDTESEPGKEIRIVEDDRDLSVYKGVPGVTILNGEKAVYLGIGASQEHPRKEPKCPKGKRLGMLAALSILIGVNTCPSQQERK